LQSAVYGKTWDELLFPLQFEGGAVTDELIAAYRRALHTTRVRRGFTALLELMPKPGGLFALKQADDDLLHVAACVRAWLAGEGGSLDIALGLIAAPSITVSLRNARRGKRGRRCKPAPATMPIKSKAARLLDMIDQTADILRSRGMDCRDRAVARALITHVPSDLVRDGFIAQLPRTDESKGLAIQRLYQRVWIARRRIDKSSEKSTANSPAHVDKHP
jgi:hypothetical protein